MMAKLSTANSVINMYAPTDSHALSVTGSGSAVQHFNFECARLGLTEFPCAIQSLTGACRGAAGGCRTCANQTTLAGGPTAVPVGLVARIKRSADPDTAKRIV